MMDLKTRLSALLYDDESESISDNPPEKKSFAEPAANTTEDLILYEASAVQIDAWHVWREFLRKFLHNADWLLCAILYNSGKFKIGLDRNRQRAIFAIDDTHYYAFDFDEVSGQPKNPEYAYRVLLRLNARWNALMATVRY